MKGSVTLLSVLVSVVLHVSAQNYCDSSLCPLGRRHILCNQTVDNSNHYTTVNYDYDTERFYQNRCYGKYRIPNTKVVKEIALRSINGIRDQVAAGYHPQLAQASRMPIMNWNEELARIAEEVVKRCPYEKYNVCLNTPTYRSVSWLFYQSYGRSNPGYGDYFKLFKDAMDQWRANEKFITAKDVAKPAELFLKTTDFTIFINQRATQVGCSLNFAYEQNHVFVACLFSATNVALKPVYDAGKVGSLCKKGKSSCYTSLCL